MVMEASLFGVLAMTTPRSLEPVRVTCNQLSGATPKTTRHHWNGRGRLAHTECYMTGERIVVCPGNGGPAHSVG
jgi:hypothetical protein